MIGVDLIKGFFWMSKRGYIELVIGLIDALIGL